MTNDDKKAIRNILIFSAIKIGIYLGITAWARSYAKQLEQEQQS